ncbi:MAG: phosphatidylinositol-3-phosphate phosphatase [Aeromicrobium sp.]|nr:phosphatidylinositol-3-phosphate phosphatase [Aeromicrobium sp.]
MALPVAAALLLGSVAACGGGGSDSTNSAAPTPTTASPSDPSPSPSKPPTHTPAPNVTKLLVFVVENHSFDQMRAEMPYTYGLAKRFGYATHFTAIRHPSLPNYIALASGSTQGITNDDDPGKHPVTAPSVFQSALDAGRTAGSYAEGMTSNCSRSAGGNRYVPRHNPWTYFPGERAACLTYDVPFTRFDAAVAHGDLPNIGLAIPNDCHNAHDRDCSLGVADDWFKTQMTTVFSGPDWKSGHLAVVLTADEDDHSSGNTILTVVIHPSQQAKVVNTPLTLYSLSRLFSEVSGTKPLANAATAPSMATAFGLPLG